MTLKTSYAFTLPRGYVDEEGRLHRTGVMRLATARDELDPLRDPRITGPDDPRLTVLVLARVIEELGTLEIIDSHVVEGLFAVDLAFLQDFYGVINFGDQQEFDDLIAATQGRPLPGSTPPETAGDPVVGTVDATEDMFAPTGRPSLRSAVEEIPRQTS